MPKKRSIKEILKDMRCRGDYVLDHFAYELEEAINREFKEFTIEPKTQIFIMLGQEEKQQVEVGAEYKQYLRLKKKFEKGEK